MKYKAIVFDLDGTLLDTSKDLLYSTNKTLVEYGYKEVDRDTLIANVGDGLKLTIIKCTNYDIEDEDKLNNIVKRFNDIYDKNYNNETIPYPNTTKLLKELNNMNIKVGCNSNKTHKYTLNLLDSLFSDIKFDCSIGDRINIPKKPNPYSLFEIINTLNVNKDEVLFVGDSENDMKTAINAEVDYAWVSYGYRKYEQIKVFNPTYIINDPLEILDILKD